MTRPVTKGLLLAALILAIMAFICYRAYQDGYRSGFDRASSIASEDGCWDGGPGYNNCLKSYGSPFTWRGGLYTSCIPTNARTEHIFLWDGANWVPECPVRIDGK